LDTAGKQPDGTPAGAGVQAEKVKEKLLRDSVTFSASSLFAQGLGVLRGLVVMRILGKELFGRLMTLNFLTSWTPFAQFGAVFGMQREIPRARQDEEEVNRIQDSCLSFHLLTTAVVIAGILLFAFFTWRSPRFGPPAHALALSIGFLFFAAVVLFQNLELFLDGRLRPDHRFGLIARCNRLKAIILAAVTFTLIFVVGIYGVFLAMLSAGLFAAAFLYLKSGYRLRFRLSWRTVTGLMQVGFPIMVTWLFLTALQSVDRVMILAFLGLDSLGPYGLGLQMSLHLIAVPQSLTHALMPRVYEEADKPADVRDLRRFLLKPSYLVSMVGAAAAGMLFLGLPWLARYVLPGYEPGLKAARTLVWHVPFASLSFCGIFVFMGLRKTGLLLLVQGASVVLGVVLNLVFLQLEMGIFGVALATTITFVLYGICASGFAFYLSEGHPGGMLGFMARLTLIPIYAFAFSLAANRLLAIPGEGFWCDTGKVALAILAFLVFQVPLALYLDRKTRALSDCWHIIRSRLSK